MSQALNNRDCIQVEAPIRPDQIGTALVVSQSGPFIAHASIDNSAVRRQTRARSTISRNGRLGSVRCLMGGSEKARMNLASESIWSCVGSTARLSIAPILQQLKFACSHPCPSAILSLVYPPSKAKDVLASVCSRYLNICTCFIVKYFLTCCPPDMALSYSNQAEMTVIDRKDHALVNKCDTRYDNCGSPSISLLISGSEQIAKAKAVLTSKQDFESSLRSNLSSNELDKLGIDKLEDLEKLAQQLLHHANHRKQRWEMGRSKTGRSTQRFIARTSAFIEAYSGIVEVMRGVDQQYGGAAYGLISVLLVVSS